MFFSSFPFILLSVIRNVLLYCENTGNIFIQQETSVKEAELILEMLTYWCVFFTWIIDGHWNASFTGLYCSRSEATVLQWACKKKVLSQSGPQTAPTQGDPITTLYVVMMLACCYWIGFVGRVLWPDLYYRRSCTILDYLHFLTFLVRKYCTSG